MIASQHAHSSSSFHNRAAHISSGILWTCPCCQAECCECRATTLPWYGANTADGMMIHPYTLPGEHCLRLSDSDGVIKCSSPSKFPHFHTFLVQAALSRTIISVLRVSMKQVSAHGLENINDPCSLCISGALLIIEVKATAVTASEAAQGTGLACCTRSRAAARSRMMGAATPLRKGPRSSAARFRSRPPAPENRATSRRSTPSITSWYVSSCGADLISKQSSLWALTAASG